MQDDNALGKVLRYFEGHRRTGDGQFVARCPAHEDRSPSLCIGLGDDQRVLLKCQAGCAVGDILRAVGLAFKDLFPEQRSRDAPPRREVAVYPYRDEVGTLLYEVVRFEPKGFRQRRPDGDGGWIWSLNGVRRVLFRLPELLAATAAGAQIWVVEGEKDALTLTSAGLVATTNSGGAGKWRQDFAAAFKGASTVFVIPDNDEPGLIHAHAVVKSIANVVNTVAMVRLPDSSKDVSEWFQAGGTAQALVKLALGRPEESPEPNPPVSLSRVAEAQALAEVMRLPTEDNVASLFEREHAEHLRFCKAWNTWLVWTGTHWRPERTELALDFSRSLARSVNSAGRSSSSKASFARGVETFARASRQFATEPEQWDSDECVLNTPGGTIDLRRGSVRPHNPADHLTRITNVAAVAGPMPAFNRFMQQITGGDAALIGYHQRSLGAALSGGIDDHFLLFWVGAGANGKNTLGETVEWVLGSYSKTVPTETLMSSRNERHPTDLANLRGVRLAVSSEVSEGSFWNESRIKSLTGDRTIPARVMRGDFFEFRRTHKHLIYGNSRPQLRIVDDALRRRMHVVPFPATFSDALGNKDPNLSEKLRAEAPAILAWLVEGHSIWRTEGCSLRKCEAVRKETEDYLESQSTPDLWVSERCETVKDDQRLATQIPAAKDLYEDFTHWKDQRGETPMSQTRWGEWMSRHFKREKSSSIRYRGLRLREGTGHQSGSSPLSDQNVNGETGATPQPSRKGRGNSGSGHFGQDEEPSMGLSP
ncbi:MAG: phage/plasmid primase, P4 family [Myxococcaceae bacterium]